MRNFLFYLIVLIPLFFVGTMAKHYMDQRVLNKRLPVGSISYDFIRNANPEMMRVLLSNGINVNEMDKEGVSLLTRMANENPNPEVLRFLIDSGANVNFKNALGYSPILQAAANNTNPEALSVLVAAGANVNDENSDGMSALMIAIKYNPNPEVARKIFDLGGFPWTKDKTGKSVIDYIIQNPNLYRSDLHFDIVKKMLGK